MRCDRGRFGARARRCASARLRPRRASPAATRSCENARRGERPRRRVLARARRLARALGHRHVRHHHQGRKSTASLTCRGDELLRFEAHIERARHGARSTAFERLQAAALAPRSAGTRPRAEATIKDMAADAQGISGRLEASAATSTSPARPRSTRRAASALGLIVTEVDRAFIIVARRQ